jgi:hypothetical protein
MLSEYKIAAKNVGRAKNMLAKTMAKTMTSKTHTASATASTSGIRV